MRRRPDDRTFSLLIFPWDSRYYTKYYLFTYPMDTWSRNAIRFTFQGDIIALPYINKATTLRVDGYHRWRDAHFQIMAECHWSLFGGPLHLTCIIAYD